MLLLLPYHQRTRLPPPTLRRWVECRLYITGYMFWYIMFCVLMHVYFCLNVLVCSSGEPRCHLDQGRGWHWRMQTCYRWVVLFIILIMWYLPLNTSVKGQPGTFLNHGLARACEVQVLPVVSFSTAPTMEDRGCSRLNIFVILLYFHFSHYFFFVIDQSF